MKTFSNWKMSPQMLWDLFCGSYILEVICINLEFFNLLKVPEAYENTKKKSVGTGLPLVLLEMIMAPA